MVLVDLTNKTFGRWKVLKRAEVKSKHVYWECQCSCDKKTIKNVLGSSLTNGKSTSCGCYASEEKSKRSKKYNTYNMSGEYGIGYTSKGEEFYFDLEDYDKIKEYCWLLNKDDYIISRALNNDKIIYMHRYIMSYYYDIDLIEIDHRKVNSRNNNRKDNLRCATRSQNSMNKNLYNTNTSGCVGVTKEKRRNKWIAQIGIDNKNIRLGEFEDKKDAINAREIAEDKIFKEFSFKNSQNLLQDKLTK